MTAYGPVHTLVVSTVGDNEDWFEESEIIHAPECRQVPDEFIGGTRYDCGIAWNLENVGLRWSLKYSGTPINTPGTYRIRSWSREIRGFDYVEHDGGIGVDQEKQG